MQKQFITDYQTIIKSPIEKVWDALTNPEMVNKYFFGSQLETTWEVGTSIIWKGEYEGKMYLDKGLVLEYIPNKELSFSYLSDWSGREDKPENYLQIRYEVMELDNDTQLRITQTNYDEEKVKHSEENWASVIDMLKNLIE
jgi:uncharacterized protein YndB with AHSA1/START domain